MAKKSKKANNDAVGKKNDATSIAMYIWFNNHPDIRDGKVRKTNEQIAGMMNKDLGRVRNRMISSNMVRLFRDGLQQVTDAGLVPVAPAAIAAPVTTSAPADPDDLTAEELEIALTPVLTGRTRDLPRLAVSCEVITADAHNEMVPVAAAFIKWAEINGVIPRGSLKVPRLIKISPRLRELARRRVSKPDPTAKGESGPLFEGEK